MLCGYIASAVVVLQILCQERLKDGKGWKFCRLRVGEKQLNVTLMLL